jgi:hypothetical protein
VARFSATSALNHECDQFIKSFKANFQDQPVTNSFYPVGNMGDIRLWS